MTVWFISLIVHLGIMILIVAIVITLASRIIEAAERAFVSDSELFSKYSFLNESVSQSILDEFRVGEYRLKTTGVDTLTNATVYFDINGKVVSVRNHVSAKIFDCLIRKSSASKIKIASFSIFTHQLMVKITCCFFLYGK